ncbi:DUF4260 domain-containing protein [Actinoplanes sp. NPDC051494]|uniref:DUF4260 domain-containing protein n=1 Tax=Actinoplanes sp. NPDC051494 TaxID=3363907 RepID=UPI0037B11815
MSEPSPGVVTGRPAIWLRVEAFAVAVAALAVFATTGEPWWLIPALFLVPDLSWLAYLAGPKAGAWFYNLMHSAPLPLALLLAGYHWDRDALIVAGVVGLFHIGLDRVLRYGLKYDHSFALTHLGVHGPDRAGDSIHDQHDGVRRTTRATAGPAARG